MKKGESLFSANEEFSRGYFCRRGGESMKKRRAEEVKMKIRELSSCHRDYLPDEIILSSSAEFASGQWITSCIRYMPRGNRLVLTEKEFTASNSSIKTEDKGDMKLIKGPVLYFLLREESYELDGIQWLNYEKVIIERIKSEARAGTERARIEARRNIH